MHALRHFYASVLLDGGESIKAVSEYLGHADPAMTLRVAGAAARHKGAPYWREHRWWGAPLWPEYVSSAGADITLPVSQINSIESSG